MSSTHNNKFRLKTDGNQIVFDPIPEEISLNLPISVSVDENKAKIQIGGMKDFEQSFDHINADILSIQTTEKNIDKIFFVCQKLIDKYDTLVKSMMPSNIQNEFENVFATAKQFAINKFMCHDTAKKRQKLIESDKCYVKPVNSAMGLTWKSKVVCGEQEMKHKIEQTTYQYVPIIAKLKSLFSNEQFSEKYFDFNEKSKHICSEEVFEDFCCGSIYKNNPVFTPTTIQLQLGINEFEPCNALKTKAGLHKMCAVYMEIRNIDPMLKSKLINVFLVALVKSQDIKSGGDFDKLVNKIVNELKILESEGIMVKPGLILKAILINLSSDNLGANTVMGFVESFAATYYCRICELSLTEAQSTVEEVEDKMRQKSAYDSIVKVLNECEQINYKDSKGIKKYCVFNNLQHYHILDNCTVDVMHDINEGVIQFFIKFIFQRIIQNKIASVADIQALCRDHNYGWFWKKYKPSKINVEKHNLNQNAMQSYCLMLHLPFILIKFRSKIGLAWDAMENLLQILQILYSTRIRKSDVDRLREQIKSHLSYLVEMGCNLLPKHHMTTHYPNLILKIGPLIHSWMMRFESKHKFFTDLVHLTYNYKNLPYTLAMRHQSRDCINQNAAFDVKMDVSKGSYDIFKCPDFENYQSVLSLTEENKKISGYKFIRNGNLEYRRGLMIIEGNMIFEIIHVLEKCSKYHILCQGYKTVQFVAHLNSIEIEKNNNSFKLFEIKNQRTFDCIYCEDKKFLIADSLDVYDKI